MRVNTAPLKTNREIFMEELKNVDIEEFVKLVNSKHRCEKCSNYYWDGSQEKCHKGWNYSDCNKGQQEYYSSYPEENLQIKYNKGYIHCKNNRQALILKELTDLLYISKTVCIECIPECAPCDFYYESCPRKDTDNIKFMNLHGKYLRYIRIKTTELGLNCYEKVKFKKHIHLKYGSKRILYV